MRRFGPTALLAISGYLTVLTPAAAQWLQPARNATPAAAPSITRLGVAPQIPTAAPVNTAPASEPRMQHFSGARQQQSSWIDGRQFRHHHHHQSLNSFGLPWGWGLPWIWSPIYTPAFVGVTPGVAFLPGANLSVTPAIAPQVQPAPPVSAADPSVPPGLPKATNADQKAKAGKFIAYGNTNFAAQKYLAALGRYKTASQVAPDLADTYLRQGFALVALARHEPAIKAFRRALQLQGDWSTSPVRLDQLYDGDLVAKTSHLENLAKVVEANPFNADMLALLALELYFDGQRDRAAMFFERCSQLGGNEDGLLDAFMPRPAPAGAPQPQPPVPAAGRQPARIVF